VLEEVKIAGEASYGAEGETLSQLRQVNFIFGTNGSGKTTISRVVANVTAYPTCGLSWKGGRAIECLVFNSDFARKTYATQLAGIFTLGEQQNDVLQRIAEQKATVSDLQRDVSQLEMTLGPTDGSSGKRSDLVTLRANFEEQCWRVKLQHDDHFKEAFAGLRSSKERFCDYFLQEHQSNTAATLPFDELKSKAETVFRAGLTRHSPLPVVEAAALLAVEQAPILAKKVIGKEDVDIAALIKRLGNSDWVRQGLSYTAHSDGQCPFCQQALSGDLCTALSEYFDETFVSDMADIGGIIRDYETDADRLLLALTNVATTDNDLVDVDGVRSLIARLEGLLSANKRLLAQKEKEPSAPISLDTIAQVVSEITGLLDRANQLIHRHNALVDNLVEEQNLLKGQIWRYLLTETTESLRTYCTEEQNLNNAINGLTARITAKRTQLQAAQAALTELERSITSVEPTVSAINGTLASFGFSGFRLRTAGQLNNLYEIVRPDGSDAVNTLSEGEKSFIIFLYFYHLLRGSLSESGIMVDRIVVFDDPVSSLDSDILFIVSALIKKVIDETVRGVGTIKQVFVLTHNIYFHKEVSFDPKRHASTCRAHETFWIVRKADNRSRLSEFNYNPIKTSYELLWAEVRNPHRSHMTIQNTLRRIIESYFKLLGNLDKDDIVRKFEGQDQVICASLFSWVNDGSHSVHDDLYISQDEQAVDRYLEIFKQIFVRTDHAGHYAMMMNTEETGSPTAAVAPAVMAQIAG
jgi:wobble nucleotide-excising tRNase